MTARQASINAKTLIVGWMMGALTLAGNAGSGTWTNAASGGLWSGPENWADGEVADGDGSAADFNTLEIMADNTVHLDGPRILTSLTFGDSDAGTAAGWTLDDNGSADNILTLAGAAPAITVNALAAGKSATIGAGIAGSAGLAKAGAGTLTLAGTNTYTGGTAVNDGTLVAATPASIGGTVALANNAKLALSLTGAEVNLTGKPVVASSYSGWGWMESASAFDGNTATRWWSGDNSVPAWIYVDMGANYTLGRVGIAWERANGRDYTVRVATQAQFDADHNPATWPVAATVIGDQNWGNGEVWSSFFLNGPATGRYLAVHCTGSNWNPEQTNLMISIWEIRAFQASEYAIASLAGDAGTEVNLGGNRLTVGDSSNTLFGGTLSDGFLTKTGAGTLTLSGANRYGGTAVNSGTLRLSPYAMYRGVVAYYQFNNSSDLGLDGSGSGNTLVTASGAPSYDANGKFGGALYLDGGSTLNKGGAFPTGVPTGNSPYTVAAWVKPDSGFIERGGWVGWGNGAYSEANNCRLESATTVWIYWWGNDFGGTIPSGNFFDGNYHSVVVTWDGTTEILFIDGREVNRRSGMPPPNVGAANFVVGRTIGDNNFKGWVDDLLIANRAFSAAEIADVMEEAFPVLPMSTAVQVAAGATLDLNGVNQSIGSLSGRGMVINGGAGAITFTVGSGTLGEVFSGNIQDSTGLSLAKVGAGTQMLCGTNSYAGATVISGGTLKLGHCPPDAVVYCQFNDPSSLGMDSSGFGNTLDGSAGEHVPQYSAEGKFGGAVYFDGYSSMDMASGQFPVGVPTGAAPYTVSAYIKVAPTSYASGGWLGYGWSDFGQCNNYRLLDSYNSVWNYWWGNDFGATLPSGSFTDGWHSVVGTWDGAAEKLYIDGACLNTRYPSVPNIQPRLFLVGKTVANEWLTGWVDDLMIANRAYSESEIATLLGEDYRGPVLPVNTEVQIAAGATLDLNGVSQTIGALADGAGGGGTVTNSVGNTPAVLAINPSAGDFTFSGAIRDGGVAGAVTLVKSGAGALTLSGANTYSGSTVIASGALRLGANDVLPDGSLVDLAGGTLELNGVTDAVGALKVTADSVLALGAGAGLLTFSGTSTGHEWTGSLTLTGTLGKEGPTCLRFYPDGLTFSQLRRIKINGNPVGLDADKYLIKLNAGTLITLF